MILAANRTNQVVSTKGKVNEPVSYTHLWQLNVGYQYINGLYLTTGKETKQEDYGLLSAKVSFKPWKVLTIFAKGENLTREKYQIIDGYPMPGAIFFGGLHLSINR